MIDKVSNVPQADIDIDVLRPLRKAQLKRVDEVLDNAAEAAKVILKEGPAAAMNRFNRKAEPM